MKLLQLSLQEASFLRTLSLNGGDDAFRYEGDERFDRRGDWNDKPPFERSMRQQGIVDLHGMPNMEHIEQKETEQRIDAHADRKDIPPFQ